MVRVHPSIHPSIHPFMNLLVYFRLFCGNAELLFLLVYFVVVLSFFVVVLNLFVVIVSLRGHFHFLCVHYKYCYCVFASLGLTICRQIPGPHSPLHQCACAQQTHFSHASIHPPSLQY